MEKRQKPMGFVGFGVFWSKNWKKHSWVLCGFVVLCFFGFMGFVVEKHEFLELVMI